MQARRIVTETVFRSSAWQIDRPFLSWVLEVLADVPDQHKASAKICCDGDDEAPHISVKYSRLETNEEMATRLGATEINPERSDYELVLEELSLLEELRRKYAGFLQQEPAK